MSDVDDLRSLFKGAEDYYGGWNTNPKSSSSGKVEVKHTKIPGKVTRELWESHVKGENSIGIYPIFNENICQWGCIDLDVYSNPPTGSILKLIEENNYPLSVCRSKSRGLHIFLFMEKPVLAKQMRNWLKIFASKLKIGSLKKDIFPAQDRVIPNGYGNFVNMPYFGNTRLGIGPDGKDLNLSEFLKRIKRAKPENLERALAINNEIDSEGPPCLSRIIEEKQLSNNRNTTLFNIAVLYRKMGIVDIGERLQVFNLNHCTPPLSWPEVDGIVQSHKKGYGAYQCDKEPLIDFCDRATCLKRKYGVSKEAISIPEIALKHLEEDGGVRYEIGFFDLEQMMNLSADELPIQIKFRTKFYNTYDRTFPSMSKADWENYLNLIGKIMKEVQIPQGIRQIDELKGLLKEFIKHKFTADRNEVYDGKAWVDKLGLVNIAMTVLRKWLIAERFNVSKSELINLLTTITNGDPKYNLNLEHEGVRTRIWVFQIPVAELEEDFSSRPKADDNEGEPL